MLPMSPAHRLATLLPDTLAAHTMFHNNPSIRQVHAQYQQTRTHWQGGHTDIDNDNVALLTDAASEAGQDPDAGPTILTVPVLSVSVDGRWCAGRGAVRTVLTAACHIRRSCPVGPVGPV